MKDEYKLEMELKEKLKPYANNSDFVFGVMTLVEHIDDMRALLEFINGGSNVTSNSIIELSYHLRCSRDGEPEYQFKKSSFNNFR